MSIPSKPRVTDADVFGLLDTYCRATTERRKSIGEKLLAALAVWWVAPEPSDGKRARKPRANLPAPGFDVASVGRRKRAEASENMRFVSFRGRTMPLRLWARIDRGAERDETQAPEASDV